VTDDLVTDRLVLRPLTVDEARAIEHCDRRDTWADGYPTAGDREVAAVLLASAYDEPHDLGIRQLVDRDSGLVIGGIGFYGGPDPDGGIVVGYGIAEEFRGRGLTTEALVAMVELAAGDDRVTSVIADTEVDNIASRRVMEKTGFAIDRADHATVYYRLDLQTLQR
jgi:RimJ/RimL family protein N-acetyltransferase